MGGLSRAAASPRCLFAAMATSGAAMAVSAGAAAPGLVSAGPNIAPRVTSSVP
jgi:hypothetical protein